MKPLREPDPKEQEPPRAGPAHDALALDLAGAHFGAKSRRWTWAILLVSAAMIAALWMLAYERAGHERDEAVAAAVRQNSNLAMALEEHSLRTFSSASQALAQVAREYQEAGPRLDIMRFVRDGAIDHSFLTVIGIADERGNVLHDSLKSGLAGDFSARDFFSVHRDHDSGKLYIGKPLLGPLSGEWAISVSRRIGNADGSFGGVVFAGIRPDYFIQFYKKARLGHDGLVHLLGLDGITRARLVGDEASFGHDSRKSSLFGKQAAAPIGNFLTRGVREGVPRYESYRTLRDYPLVVAVGTSQREALADALERERLYYGFSAAGTVFILSVAAILLGGLSRQRRALVAVARSDARSRATFDQAAVGIALAGLDGRFLQVNRRFSEMLGYPVGELPGLTFAEITHPDDRAATLAFSYGALDAPASGDALLEKRYLRKDGSVLWVALAVAVVRDAEGAPEHFVGMVQDITARIHAEAALRSSESSLKQAQRVANLGSWELDLVRTDDLDRNELRWSDQVFRIFGCEPGAMEVSNESFFRHVHPGDREAVRQAFAGALATGTPYDIEHRIVLPDGGERVVHEHAELIPAGGSRPARMVGTVQDITERKRAESAMAALQTRLQAALTGGNVGLWDWDLLTDKVFYSTVWKSQLGYREDEIGDELLVWEKLCHPDDLKSAHAAVERCLADPGARYQIEFRMKHKSGEWRWMLAQGTIQRTAEGLPVRMVGCHIDITERKWIEEQQRLSDKVIASIADGVVVTDSERRIVFVNKAFSRLTGYAPDEVLGKTPAVLRSGRQDEKFYQEMWRRIDETGHWQGEIWNRRKSGEIYPELLSISAVRNGGAKISNYVGVFNDISAFKKYEERLAHQAQYDALTDLPNRLLLTDRLEVALSQAQRSEKHVALLFLDLDRFKNVNDSFGHDVGDALLREAAERLKTSLRAADTISRQGGDEFLVILPEIESDQDAARVAEKLIAGISRPFTLGEAEVVLTASVGIACFPENGNDPQSLLRNADAAMYSAKSAGRNCYQFYTADMNRRAHDRLLLESELRHAIDREELFLVYQPQVDLGTGAVVGLEALVRWKHPERGVVSPADFIGVAEESGLIAPIGRWVLETACRQHAAWIAEGLVRGTMAVNVSAYQFRQPDFVQVVTGALSRSGLRASDLEVEVTESVMMQGIDDVLFKLNSLDKLGVKIAIDDFGTGYSSLSYLKQFPIYRLKVDQSFTRGLPDDRESGAIAQAIISMGHSLGLNVLAEGVETADQEDHLRSLWCDVGQGYLYARPFPAKECEEYLRLHAGSAETVLESTGA